MEKTYLSAQTSLSAQEIHVGNNLILGSGSEIFTGGGNRGFNRIGGTSQFDLVIDGIEAYGNHNLNPYGYNYQELKKVKHTEALEVEKIYVYL